ncbi:MAG TPA: inorganic diphosphatase [Candidatus Dormibacteraeota bacterium]|jgi:inorganic pyrophosphatase|nr:inorganic diphosphatase [Candidatus Dormibacteraeota bacterium]
MRIEVVVEVPAGSRNKYEVDHTTGAIWLDRQLFTATRYPVDYGFIPETLAEDGDPLDCMVILNEPTFPGCHLHVRPLGVFAMADEHGRDAKILAVLDDDVRNEWRDIGDVPDYLKREIHHFFDIYKELEPGKRTETTGWADRAAAEREIAESRGRYGGGGE